MKKIKPLILILLVSLAIGCASPPAGLYYYEEGFRAFLKPEIENTIGQTLATGSISAAYGMGNIQYGPGGGAVAPTAPAPARRQVRPGHVDMGPFGVWPSSEYLMDIRQVMNMSPGISKWEAENFLRDKYRKRGGGGVWFSSEYLMDIRQVMNMSPGISRWEAENYLRDKYRKHGGSGGITGTID